MAKKSLILYASWTGNTEKVALRFKKVLEQKGWQCDILKVDQKTDVKHPPFQYEAYDLLCVGSPVVHKKPVEEVMSIMAGAPLPPSEGGPKAAFMGKGPREVPEKYRVPEERIAKTITGKIVFGPDAKKGVVFMTYGGTHLGPKEAAPAMSLMALEMEHIPFQCVGQFACPGKHGNKDRPDQWFKDLTKRPNERDLQKAEIFMAEVLEEIG